MQRREVNSDAIYKQHIPKLQIQVGTILIQIRHFFNLPFGKCTVPKKNHNITEAMNIFQFPFGGLVVPVW